MMLQAKSSTTMMMDGDARFRGQCKIIYIIRAQCNLNKVVKLDRLLYR